MGGHDLIEKKEKGGGVKKYIDGSDEMMENLREYCLYKTVSDPTLRTSTISEKFFYNYITKMYEMCYYRFSYDCYKTVIGDSVDFPDIEDRIEKCVDNTFNRSTKDEFTDKKPIYWKDDNPVLEEMHAKWISFGHHFYPSVIINNSTFRGEVSPDNVFEGICSAFEKMPKKCE